MPREIITHLSPRGQKDNVLTRIFIVSAYFAVFLFGSGILTFIILSLLQAFDPQRFTGPDWSMIGIILLGPIPIAIMFGFTSQAIASLVRNAKLDIRGVEVIGKSIPGTGVLGGDNEEDTTVVEFETPDGIRHHVRLATSDSSIRIRYDPRNLSNVVVIPEPRPSRHPVWGLFSYCGCLLGTLMLLGCTLFILVLCVSVFIFPEHPPVSPPMGP